MRRTAVARRCARRSQGIISAHAENRRSPYGFDFRIPDHLRACGEQAEIANDGTGASGSSPRMRRTVIITKDLMEIDGIISAHAENSRPFHGGPWPEADHLRACGEQPGRFPPLPAYAGSSPRMRRTVTHCCGVRIAYRIISAHAENSTLRQSKNSCRRDHLRACGEQGHAGDGFAGVSGSSPRMRRTAGKRPCSVESSRIISAHAENSKTHIVKCVLG